VQSINETAGYWLGCNEISAAQRLSVGLWSNNRGERAEQGLYCNFPALYIFLSLLRDGFEATVRRQLIA
jgi:hypothetical protein